jgi:hypothetical protein
MDMTLIAPWLEAEFVICLLILPIRPNPDSTFLSQHLSNPSNPSNLRGSSFLYSYTYNEVDNHTTASPPPAR